MDSQESRLPALILHPLTLLAASANRVGMSPFSISADKGYHSTVCIYSAKIFLSFKKDSHISAAHWGCLQPVITPKLRLGITWEMPAGPCQGLCSPPNTVDSLVLLPEPVPRTCIAHQLRCSCFTCPPWQLSALKVSPQTGSTTISTAPEQPTQPCCSRPAKTSAQPPLLRSPQGSGVSSSGGTPRPVRTATASWRR